MEAMVKELPLFTAQDDIIEDDRDTETIDTYEDGSKYPYDMPEEVDIKELPHTIFEWMRKYDKKPPQLITNPEFQRNLVWKPEQKSKFIESVLLNIPLPPLYVNQNIEGQYVIVDGLQRTTTLAEFILMDGFKLSGLDVLKSLNGCTFSKLSGELQTRIEDRKMLVYVIRPSVPLAMVYDIFYRINTGGTQLTRQEIRNCLYLGSATRLLKELSEQYYFKQAIGWGISSKRMKDQEAILRYLAFTILNEEQLYKDMDSFLSEALKKMNRMLESQINELREDFARVMKLSYEFFGDKNFRLPTPNTRGRINIAMIESIGRFFSRSSDQFLHLHRAKIEANYQKLLTDPIYRDAIQFATGDRRRVLERFALAEKTLGEV
jgi:uncharacterized protein with ParB-like and HNH nuclease domain